MVVTEGYIFKKQNLKFKILSEKSVSLKATAYLLKGVAVKTWLYKPTKTAVNVLLTNSITITYLYNLPALILNSEDSLSAVLSGTYVLSLYSTPSWRASSIVSTLSRCIRSSICCAWCLLRPSMSQSFRAARFSLSMSSMASKLRQNNIISHIISFN